MKEIEYYLENEIIIPEHLLLLLDKMIPYQQTLGFMYKVENYRGKLFWGKITNENVTNKESK